MVSVAFTTIGCAAVQFAAAWLIVHQLGALMFDNAG
jgi:hypothetical protein